jgi:hypothetical protein
VHSGHKLTGPKEEEEEEEEEEEYYIFEVFIVGYNLSIKLKYHSFPDLCLYEFFLCRRENPAVEVSPSI